MRARGEGGIYQRPDGRWEGKLDLGRKPDGKRDRRSVYGPTRRAVAEKIKELRDQASSGTLTRPGTRTVTVAQLYTVYVAHLDAKVATGKLQRSTRDNYETHFRLHVLSHIGELRIIDVRASDIEHVIAKPGLGSSAHRKIYLACLQAFNLAVRDGLAPRNVVLDLKNSGSIPVQHSVSPPPADPHDIALLLKVSDEYVGMTTAIRVLAETGFRRVELLALQFKDVDLAARILNARVSKTGAGVRHQHINDNLAAYLASLGDHHPEEYLVPDTLDPFKARSPRAFNRSLERVCKRAGVRITPHQFKHAVGAALDRAGVAKADQAKILGHADESTLPIYHHESPTAQVDALNRLSLTPPLEENL